MAPPLLLRHPSSRQHDTGSHPERIARIEAVEAALEARDWLGWDVRESQAADVDAVYAVHPQRYVGSIEAASGLGGGMLDADTVISRGSYEAALDGAGGAIGVVDALLGDDPPRAAMSLHRPPGHHALPSQAMGFCLFNHVAIAARWALEHRDVGRVLIFDWDVHHGNGTNDVFHDDPDVLFVSIHESPLYPGSGPASDVGEGDGEGFTVNLPVPGGSGDATWCSLVEHVVVPLATEYRPGLVLVSAGYDAHFLDPLASCRVTREGFASMAASVRGLADDLGVPLGLVLEGGYDLQGLSESVVATLEVVGADGSAERPALAVDPLAAEAAVRLAGRWPSLAGA